MGHAARADAEAFGLGVGVVAFAGVTVDGGGLVGPTDDGGGGSECVAVDHVAEFARETGKREDVAGRAGGGCHPLLLQLLVVVVVVVVE